MSNAQNTQQADKESMKVDTSADPLQHERVEHVARADSQGSRTYDEVAGGITAPGTEELGQQARGDDNHDGRDESQVSADADPQTTDMRGPATGEGDRQSHRASAPDGGARNS